MFYNRFLLLFGLIFSFAGSLPAQALYRKPVKVLGDPNFIGTAANPTALADNGPNVVEGRELSFPLGVALDTSVSPPILYIADAGNNRVLGYQYGTQFTPGALADIVIGQTDRFSNLTSQQNGRSGSLNLPSGLAVDASGNLYIADNGNNRIVRFPKPFAQPSGPAIPDLVIGQTSLAGRTANAGGIGAATLSLNTGAASHTGLAFDSAGNLWVSDTVNNRVLRYPAALLTKGINGPAADLVLGQMDFTSTVSPSVRNSKANLASPQGLAFDDAGRLLVTDLGSRVLVYSPPFATGASATRVLGVDTAPNAGGVTAIQLNRPFAAAAAAGSLFITDTGNNRVLTYPSAEKWVSETLQFSPSAAAVTGQNGFAQARPNGGNPEPSASSFSTPADIVSSGTELYVADGQNNRVLVFGVTPAGVSATATRVIGQLDFPYNAVNLIEGKEFFLQNQGSAILDQSVSPPRLYVADTFNNRVLGFSDFTHLQNGQKADIVIGQPDFKRNLVNYPTNDPAQPSASSLNGPRSLAVDSAGNLYVADTGNSRVLRFPVPFASGATAGQNADLVIGQRNFTSVTTDPTASTMFAPFGIALTADAANAATANSGWLVVSDNAVNRVLLFPKPFSNGMNASKVLGSPDFINPGGGSTGPRFSQPRGVAVDTQDRVMVADTGNHRVQIFNPAAAIGNFDNASISISSGLSQPVTISANSSGFWVADLGQSSVLHYPTVDLLGIRNNAPDASQPIGAPSSAFVDSFGNLLASDGGNRILYFAPQISVTSAANYSPRPVTAGSIAALFATGNSTSSSPVPMPNVIASGTESFKALPLPTTLADTQVLVNGIPAPLFYVSPSQINMVLPNALPTGGSADIQVIGATSGQTYGAAEVQLASADPALFTANGTGSGQVSAINFADGSVNSPGSPVTRGQVIELFGTGVGPVTNAPPDGQAPTVALAASPLPQISLGPSNAGSTFVSPANILYSGLAPTLVGVWQINLLVPTDAPQGSAVPIRVFQNSIQNVDAGAGGAATTIAIK